MKESKAQEMITKNGQIDLYKKREDFAVNEIKSNEDKFSYLDKSYYRVRFKYAVGTTKGSGSKSRPFC